MAGARDLDGLMKWAHRPEWADLLEEMIERHIARVCDGHDIDPETLAGMIGDAAVANLLGCAIEDMIAHDFDGRNVADDYLKRRGWKESAGSRAYINALRHSRVSLYEVSGIRRDEGFYARDLLRGGEPIWVNERLGTHDLAEWDRLAMRIIEVRGRVQMSGAVLHFSRAASEEVVAAFEQMKNATPRQMTNLLTDVIEEAETAGELLEDVSGLSLDEFKQVVGALAEAGTDEPMGAGAALKVGASEFTAAWLADALGRLTVSGLPQFVNSEGEPIQWFEIAYPLAAGAKQADIASALSSFPALRPEGVKFWNWVETKPTRKGKRRGAPKSGRTLLTQMDDGATVLGTLELKGRKLTLAANSQGRADRGRALIEPRLGSLVGAPRITSRTNEELLAERRDPEPDGALPEPELPEDLRAGVLKEFMDRHYAAVLDEPIPALGDVAPRKAVGTAKGREKVIDWLKGVENHHAHWALRDGTAPYDCRWMWEELGLSDRRG
jgi:hypothetical protein